MKRVLVATDFSTRSDRALRRAIILARALPATLDLVHVVDADQPEKLVRSQQRDATALLRAVTATIRKTDDVPCKAHVVLGEPFQAISDAAEEFAADLTVRGRIGGRSCAMRSWALQSNARSAGAVGP